jgi:phospholipase C
MRGVDRRTLLKSLGAMTVAPLVVRCGKKEVALSDRIDTVVVLMLENRSFDHYLGTLSLDLGRDVDGLVAGMSNLDSTGSAIEIYPETARCVVDLPHSWNNSRIQFAEGRNDGFVAAAEESNGLELAGETMGYLTRDQIPIIHALADHHAISERWFCSVLGGTWPNRFYTLAGQSGGEKRNNPSGDYSFFNVFDRMQSAGRTWATYYNNVAFGFLFPRNYSAMFRSIEAFFEDAAAGTLPNLTLVEPIYGLNDDHPPGHPLAGQIFMATIYDALAKSPQWNRTLFIVTYDEHGGFFDHVPPPKAPDERAAEGFDQLGFRVPTVVAGPWVKKSHIERSQHEHTSILALLTTLFGTRPLTMRDAAAADMTAFIDFERIEKEDPLPPTELPVVEADDSVIYAPECRHELFGRKFITGQPELELFLDANPIPEDRRNRSEQIYEELLQRAVRRGLLRRK